ncbi:MAG: O-methyltransferase, partial [Labilithrix sp.]|nr:O-methyltransferase [Labilithrix sp.]
MAHVSSSVLGRFRIAPVSHKPLPAPPRGAVRGLLALRKALLRIADAVVPPQLAVFDRMTAVAGSHVVGELARLKVADLVEERPLTAPELAAKTGTDPAAMLRAMRGAVSMGFFHRDAQGRYSNNRLSDTLRSTETYDVRSFAEYFGSRSNMRAWCDFPESLRTGKSAFERVHGKSIWAWFDEHPEERQTFANSMMAMTLADAPGIARTYPFAEVSRLCDVGGGRGTLLSEILVRHPHLRAVLCDNADVLKSARELLTKRDVIDRVELSPGSFFDSVPKGCDAYVMKHILHDWDDERCIEILKNCRAAMAPGTRLLVIEAIVEDATHDYGALADLHMLIVCCDGRERGRADFEKLFVKSGFRLNRVLEAPTPV